MSDSIKRSKSQGLFDKFKDEIKSTASKIMQSPGGSKKAASDAKKRRDKRRS